MLMTSNATQERVVPFWNEIKKLSRQDRSELANLIEISLVNDEVQSSDVENFLEGVDNSLLKRAAEYAHKQYLEGKCIPHDEVMSKIKEEMGWT